MTCPYFSMENGKVFCNVYGLIDVSKEKFVECHSCYPACFEEANAKLREEQDKALEEMARSVEGRFCSIMEGGDIEDMLSKF